MAFICHRLISRFSCLWSYISPCVSQTAARHKAELYGSPSLTDLCLLNGSRLLCGLALKGIIIIREDPDAVEVRLLHRSTRESCQRVAPKIRKTDPRAYLALLNVIPQLQSALPRGQVVSASAEPQVSSKSSGSATIDWDGVGGMLA